MAIRVVDMALPVHRSAEMQANQRGDARSDVQQQQFAQRLSKEQEIKEQQVQETPKPEGEHINKDGRGSGGAYSGNRKKEKKEKKSEKTKQSSSSMFDISV